MGTDGGSRLPERKAYKHPKPGPDDEIDADGILWTPNSYTLPDGTGETFGPNHPATPAKVLELRKRKSEKEN